MAKPLALFSIGWALHRQNQHRISPLLKDVQLGTRGPIRSDLLFRVHEEARLCTTTEILGPFQGLGFNEPKFLQCGGSGVLDRRPHRLVPADRRPEQDFGPAARDALCEVRNVVEKHPKIPAGSGVLDESGDLEAPISVQRGQWQVIVSDWMGGWGVGR